MKIIIDEGHKGFLFRNGAFVKMLGAGKYRTFGGNKILLGEIGKGRIVVEKLNLLLFEKDEAFRACTLCERVKNGEISLHFVDGVLFEVLQAGKYYFWKESGEHTFLHVDLSSTEIPEKIPASLYTNPLFLPYVMRIDVSRKQRALLFFDKKFERILDVGTYFFLRGNVRVEAELYEVCLVDLEITGQELLTADKVTLRISCVCTYRVADLYKAATETEDYIAALRTAMQLILREYVEARRLDEILAGKNELSAFLLEKLREKAAQFSLEIHAAAVRDIILPGEIRDIMNTVLVAEKRAQANVITRREEVASTRSLLNTARLMDENETLYKLKELEYVERICEKIGSINLNGNADLLSQLTAALCGKKKD